MNDVKGTGEMGIVEDETRCDGQPKSTRPLETVRWGDGELPKDLTEDVYVPQMGMKADRMLFGDHGWGDVGDRAKWTW